MVDFSVAPGRTALVNVDLQNFFVDSAETGPTLVHRINQLAEACREAGILVIHTAHILRPDGSNIGILGEIVPEIGDGLLNRGAETAALYAGLNVDPRDVVLEKPRFGAFYGTDLLRLESRPGHRTSGSSCKVPIIASSSRRRCCRLLVRSLFVGSQSDRKRVKQILAPRCVPPT